MKVKNEIKVRVLEYSDKSWDVEINVCGQLIIATPTAFKSYKEALALAKSFILRKPK